MRSPLSKALVALASLTLLGACSGQATTSSASSSSQPESSTAATAPEATASPAAAAEAVTFPLTVASRDGEVTIPKRPERIVVVDMAALDTLDAIGAGDRVVGTVGTSVPSWLKDAEGIDYSTLPKIGSVKELDQEAIAKLNPDLIILGARNDAAVGAELAKNWTTINAGVTWAEGNYSQKVAANVQMVADAVGERAKGAEAAKKITDALNNHQDTAKSKGTAMVLMTNADELSVHGKNSRWAPIYDVFGFQEAMDTTPDEGHKAKSISFETVKETDPDYIFVVDRAKAIGQTDGVTPAEQLLDNDLVNSTKAARNGHIVYLTPERWYVVMAGAGNFLAELDEIAAAIK
ncbi:Uncharacterized ABC transporter solute-binding protein yclQ precursor [Actinomyces bovis]|uniref:Uncharacterized ABC transporter solute-binding protein yclQ n=1 Tax=Actinomyces bovis TaxID=1658 RepID=A0ABY1VPL8_9ACTO|nr:ABC transporter substrate-binding protein [Actinomyces bovis]SPT53945.1 Uncharacterized ABC transporter solute-binding protein yclQ precursor [Actinomyces bovis]VEG53457.1 Uncharacterized ABC transporter solute-binding protein yclQ precursor [Actinomyces israelii]